MTNYSPLHDAIEESDEPVTASDMVDAGYDDFEQNEVPPQLRVASALNALDGQTFDDPAKFFDEPAKWHIVNELVALLVELDERDNVESEITLDGYELSISFEPQAGMSR